jgi:hypothetical protein
MPSSNLFSSFLKESRGLGTLGSHCVYSKRKGIICSVTSAHHTQIASLFVKPGKRSLRIAITEKDHYKGNGRFEMSEELSAEARVTPETSDEVTEGSKEKAKGRDVLGMIKGALDTALAGRGNVIMVRVNDETLKAIDMLVEAGVCKGRSEGAAFLINQGIEASSDLYDRISGITEQITELKAKLRDIVIGENQE